MDGSCCKNECPLTIPQMNMGCFQMNNDQIQQFEKQSVRIVRDAEQEK